MEKNLNDPQESSRICYCCTVELTLTILYVICKNQSNTDILTSEHFHIEQICLFLFLKISSAGHLRHF